MSERERIWPGMGRLRKAANKTQDATVIFVHHYGGTRASSHWHQAMVNDWGYDAFSFNLSHCQIPSWQGRWPEGLHHFRGIVEQWAVELDAVLEALNGRKILYTFSFPSIAVPALLSQQRRNDVDAWICDGGPFLEMLSSQWRLFTFGEPTPNLLKRAGLTLYSYANLGGPLYTNKVKRWMQALDPRLPILSIRCGRDRLVPPRATDRAFSANPALNLHRFLLPQAGHLEGLKLYAPEYTSAVRRFLSDQRGPGHDEL